MQWPKEKEQTINCKKLHSLQFYSRVISDTIHIDIYSVSQDFLYKEVCHLNSFKSTGLDDIPVRLIKDAATVLTKPITNIVILSIASDIVPG
jgi:hypothetical protein